MRIELRITLLLLTALFLGANVATAQSPATDPTETVDPAYEIGAADVLRVWIFGEAELGTSVTVRPDGRISVPLAGTVDVAGRTPEDVEAELRQRFETFLGDPVVVVIVEQINSKWISVLGEVRNSGRFPIRERLTVLDAIALAGGFTEFANAGEVRVLRSGSDGTSLYRVDVRRFFEQDAAALPVLQPGDTVFVR